MIARVEGRGRDAGTYHCCSRRGESLTAGARGRDLATRYAPPGSAWRRTERPVMPEYRARLTLKDGWIVYPDDLRRTMTCDRTRGLCWMHGQRARRRHAELPP